MTPEKHGDASSSRAMMADENAQLLREAGDMSPDLTMNSIVEVSNWPATAAVRPHPGVWRNLQHVPMYAQQQQHTCTKFLENFQKES